MSIGYPERVVAGDVNIEIDHGSRVGIVGDNGQGKTTFLRTVCESLEPKTGTLKWGHGCQLGVYAQHVYTTLPDNQTVEEYLDYQSAPGTTIQQLKDVAGSFLFKGDAIEKKIKVLSGGERARLVLAGLLLQRHTVLILDEPGNHLDVETVEALAEALIKYAGTVVFTSHDRHFMHRVATQVVEVADGRVVQYPGSYDDYVYRVQREIDAGLRTEGGPVRDAAPEASGKKSGRADRDAQKRLKAVERKIAKLDEEKKATEAELLKVTSAHSVDALRAGLAKLAAEIEELEAEWLELYEEQAD
jgi:ATP-binding cassette subfamily F protein 3